MIKRLQNDFIEENTCEYNGGLLLVSASFLTGAAAAVYYMERFGTESFAGVLPYSALICAGILLEAIILGCSVIGGSVLPVCSAAYGAFTAVCSAVVRLQKTGYVRTAAVFVLLTPIFFVTAVEGISYSDYVCTSVYARHAAPGREKYVLYACISFVIAASVIYAACI